MLKRLLIAVGALAVLACAALAWLVLSFDANRYKAEIAELARRATGRSFVIDGEIALRPSLFPTLEASGVRLGSIAGTPHETLLSVARLEAQIRLRALLSDRVEITRVLLEGATLHLEHDPDGRANWRFDDGAGAAATSADDAALEFAVEQISVRDARIEYRPPDGPARVVEAEHLELRPDGYAGPLSLLARLRVDGTPLHVAARLSPLARYVANQPFDVDLRVNLGDARIEALGQIAAPRDLAGIALDIEASMPAAALLADPTDYGRLGGRASLRGDSGALVLDGLDLALGPTGISGSARLDLTTERPRLALDLEGDYLDPAVFRFGAGAAPETAAAPLFSPEPLPLAALALVDARISTHVTRVVLHRATLEDLAIVAAIEAGVLAVERAEARIGDGRVHTTFVLDAAADPPRLAGQLTLDDVSMTPFVDPQAASSVRGGHVDAALSLDARGASPAALAATANGHLLFSARDIEILNRGTQVAGADLMLETFALLNPLARSEARDVIECAVLNFPLNAGRLEAETGIGITTRRLNILGGGSIDLATERLDLGVNPKPREGVGLNLAGLADFVRIGGTIRAPAATTDAAGAATAGVKVGAAVATGGLSLLAEGLLDRAEGDVDVCAVARGDVELPQPATARAGAAAGRAAEGAADVLKQAGGAVRDTFRGLFGD